MTYRDWPPPPIEPAPAKKEPPTRRVAVALIVIVLLAVGSPLATLLVAALPGSHPWCLALIPGGWLTALVVFLLAAYLNMKDNLK